MRIFATSMIFSIFLAGCAVGPDYLRPDIVKPADFRNVEKASDAASFADLPWWEIFKDPVLKDLVSEALKNNQDLRIAISRVEQMKALIGIKEGDFYPQIGYNINDSDANTYSWFQPGPKTQNAFGAQATLSWELDIWGKIRRATESATAQYLASEEGKRGVTLILVTTLAGAYFELRELDLQLEITKNSSRSFQETYNLFENRLINGKASKLETSRASAALHEEMRLVPYYEKLIVRKENHINFLLGRPPQAIKRGNPLTANYLPSKMPAGLPANLLERRPDVKEAEQRLISANAEIGVAKALYFPDFSLTGGIGPVTFDFKNWVNSWGISPAFIGPVFQGGKIDANYEAVKKQFEQAKTEYEKVFLNALVEVSNSFTDWEKLLSEKDHLEKSVEALKDSVKFSLYRYNGGYANYYEVLEAMQQLYPAERKLASINRERYIAMVTIYRALGGGWNLASPEIPKPLPTPALAGTLQGAVEVPKNQ